MLFHFKVIAALFDSLIKLVINHPNGIFIFFFKTAHFVTHLKRKVNKRTLLFCFHARPLQKSVHFNLQSQVVQESDVRGLSSSSPPSLTDCAMHLRGW